MKTKDQEEIYNLYESSFRGMQQTQPGDLRYQQHPNSSLSTGIWDGMIDPAKGKQTLTPRSENEEGSFRYRRRSTNEKFSLIKISGGQALLRGARSGVIRVPVEKVKSLFESI